MARFIVKGMRPMWKHLGKDGYEDDREFDTKAEAILERRHLQSYGFIKVYIKQNKSKG